MIRTSTLSARFIIISLTVSFGLHSWLSSPERVQRTGTTIVVARLGR
jgi:hypothetical protein